MTRANDEVLPRDVTAQPVQALGVDDSTHFALATTASSTRGAFDTTSKIVEVVVSAPCHMKFGDGTVTATTSDRLVLAGSYVYKIFTHPGEAQTHVAVIRAASESSDGVVSITKMR